MIQMDSKARSSTGKWFSILILKTEIVKLVVRLIVSSKCIILFWWRSIESFHLILCWDTIWLAISNKSINKQRGQSVWDSESTYDW